MNGAGTKQPLCASGQTQGNLEWANNLRFSSWNDPVLPEPPMSRPLPWGRILILLLAITALILPFMPGDNTSMRMFALVFLSIILEALPFMLVGSLIGGIIEEFVNRDKFMARLPRRSLTTVCLAAALGIVFPVCECAIVPVVRRLVRKGLPLSAAVAYLLGGPIVNPIVVVSTLMAYKFNWTVPAIRLAAGYLIAVVVGLVMGRLFSHRNAFLETHESHVHAYACGHAHSPETHGRPRPFFGRLVASVRHASDDFLAVAHYLVIGAAIAALAQTIVDRRIFLSYASLPLLPSLLMVLLAILLNLCSEADAFIAASFQGLLPLPAQMAFMITGPVFDLKLLLMYRKLFRRRAIIFLAGLILLSIFVVIAVMELVWRRLT